MRAIRARRALEARGRGQLVVVLAWRRTITPVWRNRHKRLAAGTPPTWEQKVNAAETS